MQRLSTDPLVVGNKKAPTPLSASGL